MRSQSEINHKYLKLAITLRTSKLQREQLSSLTYQHLERALIGLWKVHKPDCFHQAVNDIMEINANEVVAFLSTEAIIKGSKMKINDFDDLFGGDEQ